MSGVKAVQIMLVSLLDPYHFYSGLQWPDILNKA